jgi:hypothetical protein
MIIGSWLPPSAWRTALPMINTEIGGRVARARVRRSGDTPELPAPTLRLGRVRLA